MHEQAASSVDRELHPDRPKVWAGQHGRSGEARLSEIKVLTPSGSGKDRLG